MPVDYAIHHSGDDATPLRIDVRRLFDGTNDASADLSGINYQLLDERQKVILSGIFKLPDQKSYFDRLGGEFAKFHVSDPVRYYMLAPPEAALLRLSHSAPALVNAYNRPNALPKLIQIPV